jgi:predicted DNA-binding protein
LSDNERMTRDAYLSVRVPSELKAELEKLAAADKRSVASYVLLLLEEHVSAAKSGKAAKSRKA